MAAKSKRKGAVGEREWAEFLREHFGCENARRGRQHRGGPDSPDVLGGIDGTHAEVKRCEKLRLWAALEQARNECEPGDVPYVVHRANRRPWVVIVEAEHLRRLCEIFQEVLLTPIDE